MSGIMNNGEMITATMTLADEQMELFALEVGAARGDPRATLVLDRRRDHARAPR